MILCDVCKKEIETAAASYKKDVTWPTKGSSVFWHFHGRCAELLMNWIVTDGFAKTALERDREQKEKRKPPDKKVDSIV